MFQKLRFKLTLLNVAIIFILFLLLTVAAYFRAQSVLDNRTQHIARKIAEDIKSGSFIPRIPPNPPPKEPMLLGAPPPPPNFFFVKTAPDHSIISQSANHNLSPESLTELVQLVLTNAGSQGVLSYNGTKYYYLKAPLGDPAAFAIVLSDLEQAATLMWTVLTTLILVGIVCLILSFFGSLFLANRAMIPIQKAWQQQKDFLADASHELRTPLAVIQTNLDIVLTNPDEMVSSQKKWLNNIQEESLLMAKLVDSLLFLARADSNQQILDQQPFSLDAAATAVLAVFEPSAAAKGVSIHVIALESVTICGDETRMKQVLGILLDNAIRHAPPGTAISLSLSRLNGKGFLSVTDCGEGIEPEHASKIFERFYQVDKARSKGGAGLGLAIAKWIVERHRGVIQVASTPGVATTFSVQLPIV